MTDNQKRAIVRKLAGIPGVQTAAELREPSLFPPDAVTGRPQERVSAPTRPDRADRRSERSTGFVEQMALFPRRQVGRSLEEILALLIFRTRIRSCQRERTADHQRKRRGDCRRSLE
jgi:hypothetical protein